MKHDKLTIQWYNISLYLRNSAMQLGINDQLYVDLTIH